MKDTLAFLWRHPRRTGFIALNMIVLVAFIAWGAFTADMSDEGIGGVPNAMLGYTGMALLAVLWIVAWLAWAWLIARRHFRHSSAQATAASEENLVPPSRFERETPRSTI